MRKLAATLLLLGSVNAEAKTPMCNGQRFQPCVCWGSVPKTVQYRPIEARCKGFAAIILSGKFKNSFSVVVRDTENRDRWPLAPKNCNQGEVNAGLNKCSVFKEQSRFTVGSFRYSCLGASGSSREFKKVSRITIKLQDVPGSNADPLGRFCLQAPSKPLN